MSDKEYILTDEQFKDIYVQFVEDGKLNIIKLFNELLRIETGI